MKNIVLAVVITAILIAGVAGYYYFASKGDSVTAVKPAETATPIEAETQPGPSENDAADAGRNDVTAPEDAPQSIEEGEAWIRRNGVGRNTFIDRLLKTDDLIRKVATSVDSVSRSENPIKFWSFLKPSGEILVEKRGDKTYISPKNYDRFTPMIAAFEAVETSWAATSYRYLFPLFEHAYTELGNPDSKWDETWKTALLGLLALEVPQTPPELSGDQGGYIFKDPTMEELAPIHKLLIRMGPDNTARLQKKLKELYVAIE